MNQSSVALRSERLQRECHDELIAIADWWVNNAQDYALGGFYGEISAENVPVINARKGVILNARILWFFSEVACLIDNPQYKTAADRAFHYIVQFFVDQEYGGVYWELDSSGKPSGTKKQIYAQAFTIYALCAYYKLTSDTAAISLANSLFILIEQHAIDSKHGGYLEAFSREWRAIDDLRLSDKDLNYPKSQNTHLHILEAYTSLFQSSKSSVVGSALRYTINLFDWYLIDRRTWHLRMFMDLQWNDHSPGFTYGHDIEAAWLIAYALEVLNNDLLTEKILPDLIRVAEVNYLTALADDGHVKDGFDFESQIENNEAVWWVQAEAMLGYLYAYQWTQDEKYFRAVEKLWSFINQYQIDKEKGEWFWLSKNDDQSRQPDCKVGFWKCPYHNGRTMMEVIRLLNTLSPALSHQGRGSRLKK